MASGSSRGRGQGSAGAGALHALANPYLADLPSAELVAHLHRDDRRGSDFADVALVLAVRERRLAEAEARVRTLEAELGAANAESLLARRNGEIEDGEIVSPRVGIDAGAALPAVSSMPEPDEVAEESAGERAVVDVAVRSSHKVAQGSGAVDSRDEVAQAPKPLKPIFVDMRAADLVAHLNRYRRTVDFVDAALVLAARERRLDKAEDRIREGGELIDSLRDKIREREHSAEEAEAQIRRAAAETVAGLQAKIDRAAETEAALRAKIDRATETEVALQTSISTLQFSITTMISSCTREHGLTQQAAGHGGEPVPQDVITASAGGVARVAVNDATATEGEVHGDVPRKMRHGTSWSCPAPHLAAAPLPCTTKLIDDDERAADHQVTTEVPSNKEVAHGDRQVSQDVLRARVIVDRCKVSREKAQGEDVSASHHGSPQWEQQQAARSTKKARSSASGEHVRNLDKEST